MVECLTQDRGAAGSSFTAGTALCPLARHFILCIELVQPRKTCPDITEKMFTGTLRINQTNWRDNGLMKKKICLAA